MNPYLQATLIAVPTYIVIAASLLFLADWQQFAGLLLALTLSIWMYFLVGGVLHVNFKLLWPRRLEIDYWLGRKPCQHEDTDSNL